MLPKSLNLACAALLGCSSVASAQIDRAAFEERARNIVGSYETRLQGKELQIENRLFGNDERAKAMRQGVMEYLGIQPEQGTLYVFISDSMPKPLIEAYFSEGVWSGAILVQRGIPVGMTLNQWAKEWYMPFSSSEEPRATITIDPVLFDQFAITQVPTIVWDENPNRLIGGDCDTAIAQRSVGDNKSVEISTCKPFGNEGIYRIEGAVTVDYALDQFARAGALSAEERLNRMRAYFTHGSAKEQAGYSEHWNTYLSEEALARIQAMQKSMREAEDVGNERMAPLFEGDLERSIRFGQSRFPRPDLR